MRRLRRSMGWLGGWMRIECALRWLGSFVFLEVSLVSRRIFGICDDPQD